MLRLQWGCATMRTTSTWSNNEPNWHTVINRTEIQLNSVRSSWPLTTTKIHQIGDRCQRWAVRTPKTPCTGLKSAELLLCRTGKATPGPYQVALRFSTLPAPSYKEGKPGLLEPGGSVGICRSRMNLEQRAAPRGCQSSADVLPK